MKLTVLARAHGHIDGQSAFRGQPRTTRPAHARECRALDRVFGVLNCVILLWGFTYIYLWYIKQMISGLDYLFTCSKPIVHRGKYLAGLMCL